LSIRRGEVDLKDILTHAKYDLSLLDDLYKNSGLPDSIDDNFINDLLLEIREVK
jgi:hypothetical protein